MKKLSVGARLTILLNACHAGCFFKDAEKDEGDRGEILAITLTGERNSIRDDHFLTHLIPELKESRPIQQVYENIKQRLYETVWDVPPGIPDTRFYRPERIRDTGLLTFP